MSRKTSIPLLAILLVAGCPRGRVPLSDEEALTALLGSEEATAYLSAASEAGGEALGPLERAALGYLWLKDGEVVRAVSDLHAIGPRDLEKFDRRILFLLRGAAYYSQGFYSLAGKEFREAGEISLKVEEVNLEGANTEPLLLTDLLARAGAVLATPDAGLASVDLGRIEEAAFQVGDATIVSYVRVEIARRRGDGDGLGDSLDVLLGVAAPAQKGGLEKAKADLEGGGEPDLDFLARPEFLLGLASRLLVPVLPGTRSGEKGAKALRNAREFRDKMISGKQPKAGGE